MAKINPPELSEVICKIKNQQDLTADEELLYLIHIEKIEGDEAQKLIFTWYGTTGGANDSKESQ